TEWMLEHLDEDLTVDQLARRALMSPRTFARKFRAESGTTPAAWLNHQRILRAQQLLEQTDEGLEQIAQLTGFGAAAVVRERVAGWGDYPAGMPATSFCVMAVAVTTRSSRHHPRGPAPRRPAHECRQ
ncbi:MAG: helix-turn-helix domain-containing protein, partial [Pseudolysinimonas sp.]